MKQAFINYLVRVLKLLLQYGKRDYYKNLRAQPNVFIHEQAWLGENSTVNIEGTCKRIELHQGVSTRSFCNFTVYPQATLIVNENVFFNNYCSVNCLGYIEIGENVMIGEGVKIYDHNHAYDYTNNKLDVHKNEFTIGKVVIGKNTWIGSNVTILNNVEIGENVIIGANCLIYKSVLSNSIVKHAEDLIITDQAEKLNNIKRTN